MFRLIMNLLCSIRVLSIRRICNAPIIHLLVLVKLNWKWLFNLQKKSININGCAIRCVLLFSFSDCTNSNVIFRSIHVCVCSYALCFIQNYMCIIIDAVKNEKQALLLQKTIFRYFCFNLPQCANGRSGKKLNVNIKEQSRNIKQQKDD